MGVRMYVCMQVGMNLYYVETPPLLALGQCQSQTWIKDEGGANYLRYDTSVSLKFNLKVDELGMILIFSVGDRKVGPFALGHILSY